MKTTKTFKYCSKCDKVIHIEEIEQSKVCDTVTDYKECPILTKPDTTKSRLDWNFTKYVTPRKMD